MFPLLLLIMSPPLASQYKEEIRQHFDSNEIKLPTITLLTPETRKQLHSFSDMVHDVDISSVTQQVQSVCVCTVHVDVLVHLCVTFGL